MLKKEVQYMIACKFLKYWGVLKCVKIKALWTQLDITFRAKSLQEKLADAIKCGMGLGKIK